MADHKSEVSFEEAAHYLVKIQNDTLANVRILQAENDRLRARITELEKKQLRREPSERNIPTLVERPVKLDATFPWRIIWSNYTCIP